jgi:hypothetical protein
MKKIEKLSTSEKFDKVVENLEKIMKLLEDQKQPEGEEITPWEIDLCRYCWIKDQKQPEKEKFDWNKCEYCGVEGKDIAPVRFNCQNYCLNCHTLGNHLLKKQPEGWYKDFGKDMGYTEKQEEWKEEFEAMWFREEDANGAVKAQPIIDFISQLLSERIFTKEELETLKSMLEEEVEWELWVGGKELLAKISKLLNK